MEMPEMMAARLAETDRIRSKKEAPTVAEEFFISLTLGIRLGAERQMQQCSLPEVSAPSG